MRGDPSRLGAVNMPRSCAQHMHCTLVRVVVADRGPAPAQLRVGQWLTLPAPVCAVVAGSPCDRSMLDRPRCQVVLCKRPRRIVTRQSSPERVGIRKEAR